MERGKAMHMWRKKGREIKRKRQGKERKRGREGERKERERKERI